MTPRSASSPLGAGSVLFGKSDGADAGGVARLQGIASGIVGHLPAADDACRQRLADFRFRHLRSGKNARTSCTPGEIGDDQPWRLCQRCGGIDLAAAPVGKRELAIAPRLGDAVGIGADEQTADTVGFRRGRPLFPASRFASPRARMARSPRSRWKRESRTSRSISLPPRPRSVRSTASSAARVNPVRVRARSGPYGPAGLAGPAPAWHCPWA